MLMAEQRPRITQDGCAADAVVGVNGRRYGRAGRLHHGISEVKFGRLCSGHAHFRARCWRRVCGLCWGCWRDGFAEFGPSLSNYATRFVASISASDRL